MDNRIFLERAFPMVASIFSYVKIESAMLAEKPNLD
jgi:hypothetical protein